MRTVKSLISLGWAHSDFVGFVMRWLVCSHRSEEYSTTGKYHIFKVVLSFLTSKEKLIWSVFRVVIAHL